MDTKVIYRKELNHNYKRREIENKQKQTLSYKLLNTYYNNNDRGRYRHYEIIIIIVIIIVSIFVRLNNNSFIC